MYDFELAQAIFDVTVLFFMLIVIFCVKWER